MFRIRSRTRKKVYIFFILKIILMIVFYKKYYSGNDSNVNVTFDYDVTKYEKAISELEKKVIHGLGAEGKAAFLDGEEKEQGKNMMGIWAINTILSDRIPLDRSLMDPRHVECANIDYNVHINASVVIIFYNEPFSILLRTIWSTINRTPKELLHEIILVDDCSNSEPLGKRLEYYIATRLANYPIKLLRSDKRLGLIRARLKGARAATGQAIVFLDAHCETTVQW